MSASIVTTNMAKIFEINSSFHIKHRTTGKVQFLFFRSFYQIYHFGSKTGDLAIIYEVLTFSRYFLISKNPKCQVVWRHVRQLIYAFFITNNDTLFHLRWKENHVKYQNISKFMTMIVSTTGHEHNSKHMYVFIIPL